MKIVMNLSSLLCVLQAPFLSWQYYHSFKESYGDRVSLIGVLCSSFTVHISTTFHLLFMPVFF
jgi:hypothetical protein